MGPSLVVADTKEEVSGQLSLEGFDVRLAYDVESLLSELGAGEAGLLVLDLELPPGGGIEALQHVRQRFSAQDLPVLILSSSYDSEALSRATEMGVADFLVKPLPFPFLLAKVRQHVKKTRLPQKTAWHPGDTLAHYEIVQEIGQGAMGVVYRARDTRLLREVALKIMRPDVSDAQTMDRFFFEARAVARVDHPGVVRIYEMGMEPANYLAMELVEGVSLVDYARQGLYVSQIGNLMSQVLYALHAVHRQGIIHRDLKPNNILVTSDGRIKLMDFGLAMTPEYDPLGGGVEEQYGTPVYMPPEAIVRGGVLDPTSDLYACAVILYELLTDSLPFQADTIDGLLHAIVRDQPMDPSKLNRDVPKWLGAVCLKGLSKKKSDRYPDAMTFAGSLSGFWEDDN